MQKLNITTQLHNFEDIYVERTVEVSKFQEPAIQLEDELGTISRSLMADSTQTR